MASYRVDQTDKAFSYVGGAHRHVATLCLEDRRRVSKATAIANIEAGVESYWTLADGLRANVEVVRQCNQCASAYLRTDRDSTTKNNLLALPDC